MSETTKTITDLKGKIISHIQVTEHHSGEDIRIFFEDKSFISVGVISNLTPVDVSVGFSTSSENINEMTYLWENKISKDNNL